LSFGIYRKSLVDQIGGFREGFDGSQDYDLVLRFTEKADEIVHIPKILYHWRKAAWLGGGKYRGKANAYEAAKKRSPTLYALDIRKGRYLRSHPGICRWRRELISPGKVTIIIPTRDH